MSDIFVSYKAEDRPRVRPIVDGLEAEGYSVWWDEQIGGGASWRRTIELELNAAKCVIVVWSKRSIGPEGTFVHDEASRAMELGTYLPVKIDKCRPPLGFGETQALPLDGWKGKRSDDRFRALLGSVRASIGTRPSPARPVVSSAPFTRRAVVVTGALAGAGIAGVGAWRLLQGSGAEEDRSIAVMPFANLSGDATQDYFSQGIAEQLRNTLARLGGLRVIGRTSSEAVQNDDAATAAKKLGVANILTGSVRRSASTFRISAQLVDGRTGVQKWSQDYDRAPGDVITIQTDIAENVARALAVALRGGAKAAWTIGETANVAAQNLAFQARDLSYELTIPTLRQAISLLDQAISLDPQYARAYALKSFATNQLTLQAADTAALLADGRAEALRHAKTAISIAPDLPIARSALAFAYQNNLQLVEALKESRVAFSLARGDPDAIRNYAFLMVAIGGDADEGLRYVDEALRSDPLNPFSYWLHTYTLFVARRFSEALAFAERLKVKSPEFLAFPWFPITIGSSFLMMGRTAEAARAYGKAPATDIFRVAGEALVAARTGDRQNALAGIDKVRQLRGERASFQCALIHAQLRQADQAFTSLDNAWQIRIVELLGLRTNPFLDPIRKDPRFNVLVERMNFPAA